jgi:hypothetical protein
MNLLAFGDPRVGGKGRPPRIFILMGLRATLSKERLLFGAVSVALVSWTALAIVLPSPPTVYILRWLIFAMWIVAGGTGVSILFGANRSRVGTQ